MDYLPPIPDYQAANQSSAPELKSAIALFDQQHYNAIQQQPALSAPSSIHYAPLYSSQQQPLMTATSGPPPALPEQQQQQAPPIPIDTPLVVHPQDANTVFRYNPNNPFVGVPSSMDWSDIAWNQSNMFK